jgi:hypothetical protein
LGISRVEGFTLHLIALLLFGCIELCVKHDILAKKGKWLKWKTICWLQTQFWSKDHESLRVFFWHHKILIFMLQDCF